MLSPLPYHLPSKYHLYLHQAAATCRNSLISTRSSPHTPNELIRNAKLLTIPLPFGSTALVVQCLDKRTTGARQHHTTVATEPKTELGVCLGPNPISGHTMFVLANDRVVPHRAYLVSPPTFVPFDWIAKDHILHVPLPTTQPAANPATQLPLPLQVNLPAALTIDHSLNHPPQLPNLPLPVAIAATTSMIPNPFPVTLLDSTNISLKLFLSMFFGIKRVMLLLRK